MRRRLAYIAALVICMSVTAAGTSCRAAVYGHSVGIRLGNHFAADYKFYFMEHSAMDFTFGLVNPFWPKYQFLLFSAAYDFHIGTGVRGLAPYVGCGFSTGARFGDVSEKYRDRIDYFLSVDLPVGLEYSVPRKPVAFFFEWSPKVQLLSDIRFIPQSVSVGLRFRLPSR